MRGNHEYCVDCGESDFHYGFPCNPEKVARMKEKEKKQKELYEAHRHKVLKALDRFGFKYEIGAYDQIVVRDFNGIDN